MNVFNGFAAFVSICRTNCGTICIICAGSFNDNCCKFFVNYENLCDAVTNINFAIQQPQCIHIHPLCEYSQVYIVGINKMGG